MPIEVRNQGNRAARTSNADTPAGPAPQAQGSGAASATAAPQAAMPTVAKQRELQKMTGVQSAPPIIDEKAYDYVFIGAGATGGTAAADLAGLLAQAEDLRSKGFKVLMLEGGVDKPDEKTQIPVEHGLASESPNVLADPNRTGQGTGYKVHHYSDAADAAKDPKADSKGMIWKPRGEGYGGSSRMNANVFIRVDDVDWDKIALATGDPSWRAENMKGLYKELTKVEYRPILELLNNVGGKLGAGALQNLGGHGYDGKLEITTADPRLLLVDPQVKEIALKGLLWTLANVGSPMDKIKRMMSMFDPNADMTQQTEGPVLMPTTITRDGKRNGARDILLKAAKEHPDQLSLKDGVRVRNIEFDDSNKVTGVRYTDREGKEHIVKVNREAIVSTGSLETPPLLNRSGIGSEEDLKRLEGVGVKPRVILPGVGQNQGDREEVGMVFKLKKPLALLQQLNLPVDHDDPNYKKWADGQGGLLATNGALLSFQMKSDPKLEEPDLFIFAVPGRFGGYWLGEDNKVQVPDGEKKVGYAEDATAHRDEITFLILNANKGVNNGTIEVDPENPLGAPIINHHFEKQKDSKAMIAGAHKVRAFVESQLKDLVEKEVWPGGDVKSDAAIQEKFNAEKWGHHPRGGAQMGNPNDPMTVVDSNFRVLGTTGLRVIDASMLPDNIGTFIVSGLYQIGELAAKKIADDAAEGPKPAAKYNPLSIRMSPKPETLADAQKVTKKVADQAKDAGVISSSQYKRLTDGTVSKVDVDVAWDAINTALGGHRGARLGGDRHVLAHNLLLAVTNQLEKQGGLRTEAETRIDEARTFIGGR